MAANQNQGKSVSPIPGDDRAVPLREGFAMQGAASQTTGYKRMKSEPGFPQPFTILHRRFFLQSEILAHLRRLAARRDTVQVQP